MSNGNPKEKSNDYSIEQYKQCYEDFRQLWILFWRIPTIAVTISAGIFAVAFIYLWPDKLWLGAGIVFLVGHILTLILAYVSYKHRYFGSIWAATLTNIEESLPFEKHTQRTASPEEEIQHKKGYWYKKTPEWHRSISGELMLTGALLVISLISLGLSMYSFYKISPCSFGIALPSWLLILFLWLFFSGLSFKSSKKENGHSTPPPKRS